MTTIAEVSQKFDISADTLRYYERIGLIPPVKHQGLVILSDAMAGRER